VSSSLQHLEVSAPPGVLAAEHIAALLQAAALAPARRRMAFLMGTHPRAGAGCGLRALPGEVLMHILEAAVPAAPCKVVVETRHWIPGEEDGSSSDDDSSSSDDSSSDDSSSDDSDSSSDDE
jgi:hypothetical protein